jgi:adenylosuccinate lyase
MIPRYTHPDMGRIWNDERRYQTWLQVEIAAAEAMAEAGIVPAEAARDIRERGAIDVARIEEVERVTQHDVIAFTTVVAEHVGPSARWLHFGLTSSDVLDTAQALQMREACDLILEDLATLMDAVRRRAEEHRRTPMIGRTHGVHAEPMTFGLKLAVWHAELQRGVVRVTRGREAINVGQLSGAVGTFAHLGPGIEARVCERLGLQPAPVTSQVIQRDRHAELLCALAITAATLEKIALEIRGLQKTEIGEVEEPFAKGQKGSSAMPHKRNPIVSERICGLARVLRGYAQAGYENVALWHERDISHSGAERVVLPDATILIDYMQHLALRVVRGMVVHADRMAANLELTSGALFSQRVLLALVEHGAQRDDAYRLVQRLAQQAWDTGTPLRELLEREPGVELDLDAVFDYDHYVRHVPTVLARLEAIPS